VRPILVVILDPLFGDLSNLIEVREDVGVQASSITFRVLKGLP
jgi:hypothetical protein